jgi:hypothetical protein
MKPYERPLSVLLKLQKYFLEFRNLYEPEWKPFISGIQESTCYLLLDMCVTFSLPATFFSILKHFYTH